MHHKALALLCTLLMASSCAAQWDKWMTDEQKAWYSEVVLNGDPDDPIKENYGKDTIAAKYRNEFGICKGTTGGKSDNPRAELANGAFSVDPVCLPISLPSPEGGVMGDRGGRILWTPTTENVRVGSPFRVATASVPNDPNGALLVSWAEDFSYSKTGKENGRIHVTRMDRDADGAYQITKDIMLLGCVHNGGIVYNKRGVIATMCYSVCEACKTGKCDIDKVLEPMIVEIEADLSKEIRRKSTMTPECASDNKFCYMMAGPAGFNWLEYDPVRDMYLTWYGSGWGGHVGDYLRIVEAHPDKEMEVSCGTWWGCVGGSHTEGTRIAWNSEREDFGAMCTSDDEDAGLVFRPVLEVGEQRKIADSEVVDQSQTTWTGGIVACGCHFYAVWHGVQNQGDYAAGKTMDFAFARIDPVTREIVKLKWIKSDAMTSEKSTRIAVLGDGKGCNRFLVGWGEMGPKEVYPSRYLVAEVDSDGEFLTETLDVTATTLWGEDEPWETLANGDVAWGTTWKRNNDGSPSKVGQQPDGTRVRPNGEPCVASYCGASTGYGFADVSLAGFKPDWGDCNGLPG
ncbi:hypothetical protein DIPPA_53343, partial [Diplonema papillatum]